MRPKAQGHFGEEIASKWIEKKLKMKIIAKNYRSPFGEIDLIAQKGDALVFFEVKLRTSTQMGNPEESVNFLKQDRIRKTALHFMMKKGINPEGTTFSFWIVAIQKQGKDYNIRCIPDAF
jgi:putative endonuclease